MIDCIFVYGSLTTALDHPMGQRLRREARLLGLARLAGRLHRVSWYPGIRPAQTSADQVHGELYQLARPAETLDWLDEYEGIKPGGTSAAVGDEYVRAVRPVTLRDGTIVDAYVYLYQRPLPPDSLIPSGVWTG